MLSEVGNQLDMGRVHFTGKIAYADYLRLLQVSRLHIYLTYPFVLSWSVLECMASGVPLLASKTPPVQEIIKHGVNGYLFDFFDTSELIDKAASIMQTQTHDIQREARQTILDHYDFSTVCLPAYKRHIAETLNLAI